MLHVMHFLTQGLGIINCKLVLLVLLLEKLINLGTFLSKGQLVSTAHLCHQHQHSSEIYQSTNIKHVLCGREWCSAVYKTDIGHDKGSNTCGENTNHLFIADVKVSIRWHIATFKSVINNISCNVHQEHIANRFDHTFLLSNFYAPHIKLLIKAGSKLCQYKCMSCKNRTIPRLYIQNNIK